MPNLITMSRLGNLGRWGNQVFEYSFLRTYARRHNAEYQTNRWVGQLLMGHNDPPITEQLPKLTERRDPHVVHDSQGNVIHTHPQLGLSYPPKGAEAIGHDMEGYCQFHTDYYVPDREFIRDLFVPTESIVQRMAPAVNKLRRLEGTVIGLHMRRGDTGRFVFYVTPNEWYLHWLEQHWHEYKNPILFVASEEPDDYKAFAKYKPITSLDLLSLSKLPYTVYNYLRCDRERPTPISMDWFPDWYLLTQCDVLVFGNSTFSFTAAMMNRGLQQAWRSRLSTQEFERIDVWNEWPMVREDVREYPDVPDTRHSRSPTQWMRHSR